MPAEPSSRHKPTVRPAPAGAAPDDRNAPRGGALPLVLLAAGAAVWAAIGPGRGIGALRWTVILSAAAIAVLPPVASVVSEFLERLRRPSPSALARASISIALAAACYFILTAVLQDRDLQPKTHDDSSYLIQMQMLARGRLWMPAHPLADFFDSFYLLTRPVYASQYFPGTALLYVPTVWLRLPAWLMPVLAAGAVVGLVYRVLAELIDGAAAAVGALWVASLSWFRMASILLMSQVPALLFGLLMVWAWLRWRRSRRAGWLVLIGAAAGWSAITRPVDALCFAVPVAAALAVDLMKQPAERARAIGIVIVSAAPFLCVQLALNKGVTGHFFQTPFRMYLDRDVPGTQFGFPPTDPNARPQSVLSQKQEYYTNWVTPFIRRHQPGAVLATWATRYFAQIVDTTLPARGALPLATVGLLGLTDRRRWVVFATLPLFVGLYCFYTIFLEHYAIAVIPAVVLLGLLGVRVLAGAFPRFERPLVSGATVMIVAAALTNFWELNRGIAPEGRQVDDETFRSLALRQIDQIPDASDFKGPAVLLFRYHTGGDFFQEPVYNTGVPWPDDAEVIRAHDLGPARDREIVRYYAGRQPVRWFYLVDLKSKDAIVPLGPTSNPAAILQKLDEAESVGK